MTKSLARYCKAHCGEFYFLIEKLWAMFTFSTMFSIGHLPVTILRHFLHGLVLRWAHLRMNISQRRKALGSDGYVVGHRIWVCREVMGTIVIKRKGQECDRVL